VRGTETDIAYLEPKRHLRIKNPGRISISHKDFSELVVEPAGGIPGNARPTWPRGIDRFITE